MSARALRTRLTIQTAAETVADGIATRAYTSGDTVAAALAEESASQAIRAGALDDHVRAVVTVRRSATTDALGSTARFVDPSGRTWDATGPGRRTGRRSELLAFTCREVV